MLEAFIIALCIGDYGCSEAQRAYLKTPNGQYYSKTVKKMAYKHIDKESIATIGTAYAALANKKIKLRLRPGLTFEGNKDEMILLYKWDF